MRYIILMLQLLTCLLFISNAKAQVLECNCGEIAMRTVTATSGLVLRDGPSVDAKKITAVPYGEKVMAGHDYDLSESAVIENKEGYWLRAMYQGQEGFLFGGFLSDRPEYDILHEMDFNLPDAGAAPFMGLFSEKGQDFSLGNMKLQEMAFDTVMYETDLFTDVYAALKIEEEKYPYYIFSGLENSNRTLAVQQFEMEEGNLYPGVFRTVYFSGSNYTLYATGHVAMTDSINDGNEQGMKINNYQVILERRSPDAVQRQVLLDSNELPVNYWGNGSTANIRLVGDLDGDAQPDFLIENYFEEGYETSLFLSSEAEKGFLVKLVRKVLGSCC